eukprot:738126-Karenia_brevis.AAC.1
MVPAGAHGGYSRTKVMQVASVADSSCAGTYTGASAIPWAAISSTLNAQYNADLLEYGQEGETMELQTLGAGVQELMWRFVSPADMMIIEPAAA